jgi:hypothetical protein
MHNNNNNNNKYISIDAAIPGSRNVIKREAENINTL